MSTSYGSTYAPRCPVCSETKIMLAPLPFPPADDYPLPIQSLPVACSACMWRGLWRDLKYVCL